MTVLYIKLGLAILMCALSFVVACLWGGFVWFILGAGDVGYPDKKFLGVFY